MLRLGEKIRLTEKEREIASILLGFRADPRTVEEYNRLLEAGAECWESEGGPEGRLLAAMCRGEKVAP